MPVNPDRHKTWLNDDFIIVELAAGAGIGIVVKPGGSEALADIRLAKMLGAIAILEPMIESNSF